MRIRTYHHQLSFSGAPAASDFATLHQQGYRLIVNNRPDEEPGSIYPISKRKRWLKAWA
ncbi:sulfur transferase domain-containing protein [Serratia sp. B1]|nr:sulfur transferase domain-containing protein [Serratia sp. B1]